MGSLPAGEGAAATGGGPRGLSEPLRPGGNGLGLWGEEPRLDENRWWEGKALVQAEAHVEAHMEAQVV